MTEYLLYAWYWRCIMNKIDQKFMLFGDGKEVNKMSKIHMAKRDRAKWLLGHRGVWLFYRLG